MQRAQRAPGLLLVHQGGAKYEGVSLCRSEVVGGERQGSQEKREGAILLSKGHYPSDVDSLWWGMKDGPMQEGDATGSNLSGRGSRSFLQRTALQCCRG